MCFTAYAYYLLPLRVYYYYYDYYVFHKYCYLQTNKILLRTSKLFFMYCQLPGMEYICFSCMYIVYSTYIVSEFRE